MDNHQNRILDYFADLLRRYERGEVGDTMRRGLDRWTPDIKETDHFSGDGNAVREDCRKIWQQVMRQIDVQPARKIHLRGRTFSRIAATAAVILLLGGAWFAYRGLSHADKQPQTLLAAAHRRAWTTGDAHRLTLTLPDGSKVKVNAGSRLEIAEAAFNKEKREVWLTGEAFFEVAENPAKPFIIHTGTMQTTVRGTSFNVKAYAALGENVVSVRDGRVEITGAGRPLALLTANRQLKYNTDSGVSEISDTDWRDAAGWTEGRLILNGADARELKLRLRQQFGVEVEIAPGALAGKRLHGVFSTNSSLEEVLRTISSLYGIHYRTDNGHVTITP